jgi:hypothetical protein
MNGIYGRNTTIKEIKKKEVEKFLKENHIQGYTNSKIKIGLFYNDELISVMTFGNKRIALGDKNITNNDFEMIRFCNKLNTVVIGGANKLLKHFIKTYKPHTIISFADRRYSNGNLYYKLGFEFVGKTKPNYWYFHKNSLHRQHRFNFRKNKLVEEGFDKNKTENEIMTNRGYLRIYDSGNLKFIMNPTCF